MNYINPKSIIAFVLILFIALILCGNAITLAQEKSKPIDTKTARQTLSVPEIVTSAIELPPLNLAVTDTALLRLHIAYCDSAIVRLRAEQSFCLQKLKLYYPLKRK